MGRQIKIWQVGEIFAGEGQISKFLAKGWRGAPLLSPYSENHNMRMMSRPPMRIRKQNQFRK